MKLGSVHLDNPFVQAPMAGVTDAPFRTIARRFHKGLMFTEMISAEALCRKNRRTLQFAKIEDEHHPVALQLFGHDQKRMVEAAKIAEKLGPDIIDINAACPIAHVVRSGSGGALLRDLDKLAVMVRGVVDAVSLPVSVKLRLGFSSDVSLELLNVLENTGVSFLTFHGRTVSQKYGGESEWDALKRVVETASVPIIVNGDARDEAGAVKMLKYTGAEFVMIGRGIRGRPDVVGTAFDQLENGSFRRMDLPVLKETMLDHARLEAEMRGEKAGMRFMRKHIIWYLKAADIRPEHMKIYALENLAQLEEFLELAII